MSGTTLDGTWQTSISFPQYSPSGTWSVQYVAACDYVSNCGYTYTADLAAAGYPTTFDVAQASAIPSASAAPTSGASGTNVSVTGTGWDPSDGSVTLHFSSGGDVGGATVDASGNLSANILVGPTEALGSNPILVTQGTVTVTVPFTVTSLASAPTLSLSTSQGSTGSVISLTGQHWPTSGPSSGPLSVVFTSGTDTGTASVDASGNLTGSITVGATEPQGSDPIYVFDGPTYVSAAFTVIPTSGGPSVAVNPVQGSAGTSVTVTGQHWNPSGGSVQVSFAYGTDRGTATVDASGNLTGSISVTSAEPLGANQIVLHQDATTAAASFRVVATAANSPTAWTDVNQGGIGTLVHVFGAHWDPNGGAVTIRFTNGPDTGAATVDSSGNLTGSITVGAGEASGSNPIIVTQGSTTVYLSVGVLPSGWGGTSAPVGGNGLPPGSGFTISGPGGSCSGTVAPDGTFTCTFPISGPPGQILLTVTDGSITYTIPFTVLGPTATASPVSGASGTTITISGQHWNPNGGGATLAFSSGSDIGTATVDAAGNLSGTLYVGQSESAGSNPIIVTQGSTSVAVDFTVVAASTCSASAGTPLFSEFPTVAHPREIVAGPDGALWFTNAFTNKIYRITSSGVITSFATLSGFPGPTSIVVGPDGALWFTITAVNSASAGAIGRMTTTGVATRYDLPVGHSPMSITRGPDGALWFTEVTAADNGGAVGRITTSGVITEFTYPTANPDLMGIASGADGALWVAEYANDGLSDAGPSIARVSVSGDVTRYPLPRSGAAPTAITTGPDGAIWFASGGNKVGRITTTGTITTYGGTLAGVQDLTTGSDGALWFTEYNGNKIGRMTTAGVVNEYSIPSGGQGNPIGIASGPDGAIWFVEYTANIIGRLDLASPPTVSTVTPSSGPTSGGTTVTISGCGFQGTTAVSFGGTPAANFVVNSDSSITATAPTHAEGTVDITVTTSIGTSATGSSDAFTFNAPACPGLCVSVGDRSMFEGDAGTHTMMFPVTLSAPASTTVTVQYTITGDTQPGYTATGGTKAGTSADFKLKTGTITFTPNARTGKTPIAKAVSVTVFGDTTAEPDQTFAVTLSNPSSGVSLGRDVGTGTILNDDGITSGLTLGVADASIVRATSGSQSLKFEVTLSAPATSAFSVNYTITPGTATYSKKATGGGDYGGKISGTLSFAIKSKVKTITVPIWPNANSGTFTVTLSGLSGSGVTLIGSTATGTIIA